MTLRLLPVSKLIFYLLIVILPINLGLHFVTSSSYVGGLLIDYLVPTIFVQDILAFALCAAWLIENPKSVLITIFSKRYFPFICLLYIFFLSTLIAARSVPSTYEFFRWFLYILVAIYAGTRFEYKTDFSFVTKTFCIWILLLGILALGQFIKQGAVFNNYLFLGEQPYNIDTPLINHENVFGTWRVPAYGLFRHPNAFGGFLAITLTWVFYAFKRKSISRNLFTAVFHFGIAGLLCTFSMFAWAAFLLGVCFIISWEYPKMRWCLIYFVAAAVFAGLLLNHIPFPISLADNPSVYKRVQLLEAGYAIISSYGYLFGAGLNSSTVVIEHFLEPTHYLRFDQPTHNIFILIMAETGLLGLLLFVWILLKSLKHAYIHNYLIFVTLLQVIFISSFDHYFVTIQQTFLLFCLLLGIALA